MGRCPHTAAPKGKRVRIVFKDGRVIVTKFIDRTRGKWIVTEAGRFTVGMIRAFGIWRDTGRGAT